MRKFSKKATAIIGTATLAVALMALPVLAGTNQQAGSGWLGQMQGYMEETFSTEQHQTYMNSTIMQNLHNSPEMQNARQSGDVNQMQELMNLDPEIKEQVGQDNLDKMNQFLSNTEGNMMTSGNSMTGSRGTMMNGSERGGLK